MNNRDKRRSFYIVQFIELPFDGIDDYVCVPYSWIILQKSSSRKAVVTYPNNEDPLETRERVKRKERPNDSWRFYMAYVKYKSDDFEDGELRIANNEFRDIKQVSKKKDTKTEPQLNRKLRSASQTCWSETNSEKPPITVKPYKNPRKPLPRISIRRPLSPDPDQSLNNKCLKSNENSNPGILTDDITAASDSSKQEQSIIITGNQVIQKNQMKTNYVSNGKTNTEQSTQPEVIKENQSVKHSVQSTSAKLPVERQLSPQPPTKQQLSLQPPTVQEPSPQRPIDRQPSPKFIAEQHSLSKFSGKQQLSSVGQDYQQPVSMTAVDLDESKGDHDSCLNVLPDPVTDGRPSTKTPPSTFKPYPQPRPLNERPTLLVSHEHSLPESHSRNVTAGQSKEPNNCQETHLHWILSAPKIVPKSSSTTNQLFQQYGYPQSPIFPVSSTLNTKFQSQGFSGTNSIEVADNHLFLRSQDIINSMPSNSQHEHTSETLTQMLKLKARQKSSEVKKVKNPVDKKTRLEGITKKIASLQYPPNSMRQLGLAGGSAVAQSPQFAQHQLQQTQIDGSLMDDDRRRMRENFISQRDPRAQGMMNTPASQNLVKLAHQNYPFLGTSYEQQYLPTREDYLQQFTRLQDRLTRPSITPTLDQKNYHQHAMMNEGVVIQSQSNPINQPFHFLPQNVNQYAPLNNAYLQEVKSHELMKRYADGAYVIYKSIAPKEVNIQFPTLDQENYHQHAMMNEGVVIQSQSNPINQPFHFLPQNVNQYAPINNAYSQEVKSHELMKRYADGAYVIYKSIAPKEVNIQFPTLDQENYHQHAMMNEGVVIQSQSNPINQPFHFLPQNVNQYAPINNAYSQEVKSHELMKRYADGAYVINKSIAPKEVNIQFPTHHSSSQSQWDAENPQKKQHQQNYRDPRTTNTRNGLPLKSTHSSLISEPQKVTKRSRSLSTSKTPNQVLLDARSCLIQELNIQKRVNQSSTKSNNTNLAAVSETQTVELASSTENIEVQTMPSSNQIQATQFTLVQNEHDCRCSRKKTMIDQATETDSMMDVSHCVEAKAGSSLPESASRAVESVRQTDEWLEKEQDSIYQETSSDSENVTDNEIETENEVVLEANQVTLTAEQNLTQENQHEQSRIIAMQNMLDVIGTLLTQMGANLSFTRDMFNFLRNSTLVCAQTYETLLEKVDKFNSIEPLQNSASPPNNVILQVTQAIPAVDSDNTTSVDNATTSIREQKGTFSLPAEYDPNDTKWTLKYREKKAGLVELIPQTGVYVKRKELKRCKRESKDCRTLARLLLTEVFSHSALTVCSWTGGKAKAFNSVNIDVRPGLDENARMVLLTFVEQHGKGLGWGMANTSAIMSTIRTKINDIRAKHEQTCKV